MTNPENKGHERFAAPTPLLRQGTVRGQCVADIKFIVDPHGFAGEPKPARLAERLFAVVLVAFLEGADLDRRARDRHVFESKIE